MCISPTYLPDKGVEIPCRNCWQCISNKVQNWTGRNLAEATTATVSYAVTLTYGRDYDGRADHIQSVQLMYSDIQKFLKRIRTKLGRQPRYIVAGEYGAAMQRSHWHGVLHFYGDELPEWEGEHLEWSQEKWDRVGGIHIPEWSIYGDPIGFVHIKKAHYAHVRYALKYLLKDQHDPYGQTLFNMSRKPPLGYEYFTQLARETAQEALPIQDLSYYFNVRQMDGQEKRQKFLLSGRLAEIYCQTYLDAWEQYHGSARRPASEPVDIYEQFGRIGNERLLTEKRQNELQSEYEKFGEKRLRGAVTYFPKQAKRTLKDWLKERDEQFRLEKRKERLQRERNGKGFKERQRRQAEREYADAVSASCAVAGITIQQFNTFPPAWREFIKRYPRDSKSLLDANKGDHERWYPGRKPKHLWG
ncbi:replication initiation protein [Tortoise microvirus 72]|nr:replication initiation protein [Tortoise microvirus 72]